MDYLLFFVMQFLNLYMYLLIIFIFMGWIPELRRTRFYQVVGTITEPFFRIFRGLLVFNGLDFTPMVGIILYQYLLMFLQSSL